MDIKNTKEVVIAANELSLELIKILKDGAQMGDLVQLVTVAMGPLKDKVIAAAQGAGEVPSEVKDLDASEVVELVTLQASYVPQIVAALK